MKGMLNTRGASENSPSTFRIIESGLDGVDEGEEEPTPPLFDPFEDSELGNFFFFRSRRTMGSLSMSSSILCLCLSLQRGGSLFFFFFAFFAFGCSALRQEG